MSGEEVEIKVGNPTGIYIGNAKVLIADIIVRNGVVHIVEEVVAPK